MTGSRGCEHEGTKVETASNRLNGVADPEGATRSSRTEMFTMLQIFLDSSNLAFAQEAFCPEALALLVCLSEISFTINSDCFKFVS